MKISRLFIANRGEVAIRIARAASELGIHTTAAYPADDSGSRHLQVADSSVLLPGEGPASYLDAESIIAAAKSSGCDAVHPGYGFLSENAAFARRCTEEGMAFVGPSPGTLELFGDKAAACAAAQKSGVPLLPGTREATTLEEAREFFSSLAPGAAIMIKPLLGGGGRGMRPVYRMEDLEEAFKRCQSEARAAFGRDELYVEQLMRYPRHVEVQVVGDGSRVVHLGERDCSLQRRHQKLIEVSPAPGLTPELRDEITSAAVRLAQEVNYQNLGTVEFLLEGGENAGGADAGTSGFAFMEVNPRLQVEHTVTEEVTGVDLVRVQLELAGGKTLEELGLAGNPPRPGVYALQARVNAETLDEQGNALPASGRLEIYEVPTGPGVRVDDCGYSGYAINPSFDSLLAKVIVASRSPRFEEAVKKARRALQEFRVEGVKTNIPFLLNLLRLPEAESYSFHTRFLEEHAASLVPATSDKSLETGAGEASPGETKPGERPAWNLDAPAGTVPVYSPMAGKVVSIEVAEGDPVAEGQAVAVLEAMKMECEVKAPVGGYVRKTGIALHDFVPEKAPLFYLEKADMAASYTVEEEAIDPDWIRPDLEEVIRRHSYCLDENRLEAVEKRRKRNQRTARENVEDLCDPGSFIEYGPLAVAGQRRSRSLEDLIQKTPADGLITGIGTVNGDIFGEEKARCSIMAYDYTVLAGTQGMMNHKKMDRMLDTAEKWSLPVVLFGEGGGGRPGDIDSNLVAGLEYTTFARFASLSGKVPLVGILSGYCFAGNAALMGCVDVIIATENSNLGMGGPAMIQFGGLGEVSPGEVGPVEVQRKNGVVDLVVSDEEEAVKAARKYLAYLQGETESGEAWDQRLLRHLVPENRKRMYDMRKVIRTLADQDSVLELRRDFGEDIITAFIRIEGKPFGLLANNPMHSTSGAIQPEGGDKATRFMQLCDSYGLPLVSLVDTPGFMVGPEVETRAHVRRICRMFIAGTQLRVPIFSVFLRKGYGLGAQAMIGGSTRTPFFTVSWPSGEFGGMNLEGGVWHAYRKQLEEFEDLDERDAFFQEKVNQLYEYGKAINMASFLEIDGVIDPAETRRWILRGLQSVP